jgi:hypothetical protein
MKTRIAKKILEPTLLHFFWYGTSLLSLAPRNPQRYFKAHKVLHKKPYYDSEWLKLIYNKFGRPKKRTHGK